MRCRRGGLFLGGRGRKGSGGGGRLGRIEVGGVRELSVDERVREWPY